MDARIFGLERKFQTILDEIAALRDGLISERKRNVSLMGKLKALRELDDDEKEQEIAEKAKPRQEQDLYSILAKIPTGFPVYAGKPPEKEVEKET